MGATASDYQGITNVQFVHDNSQDSVCTSANNNVVFNVIPVTNVSYAASAFLPSFPRTQRRLDINTSVIPGGSFPFSLTGILRHELGHVIGLRHEHIRPESGAFGDDCTEGSNWFPLTGYDSNSVMHYPQCSGTNLGDLFLTANDIAGIQTLYGIIAPPPHPPPEPDPTPGNGDVNGDGRADWIQVDRTSNNGWVGWAKRMVTFSIGQIAQLSVVL